MDTVDTLLATVQSLWPNATAELSRGRRADPAVLAELAIVPNRAAPRLLVPVSPARSGAGALWRFNEATPLGETWGRAAMAGLVRAAGPGPFPDRIRVHGRSEGSLSEHLASLLGEPVRFSLGVGTARVNRKPVLQLFGETGDPRGFVKLGNSEQARADVRAEALSLTALAGRRWRTLATPQLLHHGTWGAMEVLAMTSLPTGPWRRPRSQWRLPRPAMAELADAFSEEARPLASLPWVERQRRIAGSLADTSARDVLTAALDALVARSGDASWTVGAWHGDWTPWNMDRHHGRVQLWDWERFERGVPKGLDPFHYCVNAVTRRAGTSPETILSGLRLAGADQDAPDTRLHALAGLYLLAAAARYLPLTAVEDGHRIAGRAQCTLDTLRSWVLGSDRS